MLADGKDARMERYGGGSIVVADYDPAWPRLFQAEGERVEAALGPQALVIEHVGSTSVPGLAAKPIIDLLVGVPDLGIARTTCIEPLVALGYTYLPEYESFLPAELFFRKGLPGPWTHHVHVMETSNPRWDGFILFRDFLRARPDKAKAYGNLKKQLAAAFGEDIVSYRNAKHAFVTKTMEEARAARGTP